MVRRRGGRKRALGTRAPLAVAQWPNDRWSLGFTADQFIDGRCLRILVRGPPAPVGLRGVWVVAARCCAGASEIRVSKNGWTLEAKIKNVRRVGDPIRYCLANKC
jgi:hypothetical protein